MPGINSRPGYVYYVASGATCPAWGTSAQACADEVWLLDPTAPVLFYSKRPEPVDA